MSDMKCPFCGRKLEQYWYEDFECWYCPDVACKGYVMTATKDMWQELIRTRKALDVAVDKLKGIKTYYDDSYADPHFVNWHIVAQRLANDADDAIKAITALEQKDK